MKTVSKMDNFENVNVNQAESRQNNVREHSDQRTISYFLAHFLCKY